MARCGCGGTCNCVIQAGDNTTVTGNGSSGNPYVVSTDVKLDVIDTPTVDLTLTGSGTTPDPYEIQADVQISTDADNCLIAGSDGGLYVACGGSGGGSNVLTGIQGGTDVVSITSTTAGAGTSEADSLESIAIGKGAMVDVTSDKGIAIGSGAYAFTSDSSSPIAIGNGADAEGFDAIAIGDNANTSGSTDNAELAIGSSAQTGASGALAVGYRAEGSGIDSVAVGQATAAGEGDVAVGRTAIANGASGGPAAGDPAAVAVGADATAYNRGTAVGAGSTAGVNGVTVGSPTAWSGDVSQTMVGNDTIVSAPYSTGLGYAAQTGDYGTSTDGQYSTAVGTFAQGRKDYSIAVGAGTDQSNSPKANGKYGIAVGHGTVVGADGAIAIGTDHLGNGASTSTQDQIALGTANHSTSVPGRFGVATRTPANSADAQGSTGDIAWDASFIYVKTGAGWKRSALSTF